MPPLVLRLVKCRIGKKKMWLLTSVLDENELSMQEMKMLYQKRWSVELEFRALKQTFGRNKLRSHKPQRALHEMEWSIMGMTVIELFALKTQLKGAQQDPHQLSFAQAFRAVQQHLKYLGLDSPEDPDLTEQLRSARVDSYERRHSKAARFHSTLKRKPRTCGEPCVLPLTKKHRCALKQKPPLNTAA